MINTIDIRSGDRNKFLAQLAKRNQLEVEEVNKVVMEIISDIKKNKDMALFEYTKKFDKVEVKSHTLKVTEIEIEEAYKLCDKRFVDVLKKACVRIEKFHRNQQEKSWFKFGDNGEMLGQIVNPLEIVGIYTPGGTASYPSSVIMNTIPAKVAGVGKVIMVSPPSKDGKIRPEVLVAAREAGVDEIYKCGGAQAVAALAFGTETVPKVDKIVGPGNIYVATAKRMVYGTCAIDMIAGPSEIVIIADSGANVKFVAADMLSQAEHDILAASILVTDSEELAKNVASEIELQLKSLNRGEIARKSVDTYGMVIIVKDIEEAFEISNIIAPEHLEICVEEAFAYLPKVKHAGAVFLGKYSTEPIGDYFAGPNHVLPTSGTARFFSALGVYDFVKRTSVISMTQSAVNEIADDVAYFADAEGLDAHAKAVRLRMNE